MVAEKLRTQAGIGIAPGGAGPDPGLYRGHRQPVPPGQQGPAVGPQLGAEMVPGCFRRSNDRRLQEGLPEPF